jgi:RHS repeat-associated protein
LIVKATKRSIFTLMLGLLIFGAALPDTFGTGESIAVGVTPGTFSVNQNGAATYKVSIEAPPGTHGMQPDISLEYNSQRGNGLLGIGWDLAGLSVINRCGATQAQDGFRGGINFDVNDRFSLDGNRLIAMQGNYGYNGTVYTTENQTWFKVTQSGKGFIVQNKAGWTLEYGCTDDARLDAPALNNSSQMNTLSWFINKMTDLNGNYIEYHYQHSNGDCRIESIIYTGNAKIGLTPQRAVWFVYGDRVDAVPMAVGRSLFYLQSKQRLMAIETYVADQPISINQKPDVKLLIKKYTMEYDQNFIYLNNRLISVQESDKDGFGLSKTTFTWPDTREFPNFTRKQSVTQHGADTITYLSGDVNGDGRTDNIRLWKNNGRLAMTTYLADRECCLNEEWVAADMGEGPEALTYLTGDVNADGNTDIMKLWDSNGRLGINTYLSDGRIGYERKWQSSDMGQNSGALSFFPGDVNGDGRTDLIQLWDHDGTLAMMTYLSNGTGYSCAFAKDMGQGSMPHSGKVSFFPGDVNGDGKTDIIQLWEHDGVLAMIAYLSNGTGYSYASIYNANNMGKGADNITYLPGDVNGDGKTDIMQLWKNSGNLAINTYVSNGTGYYGISSEDMAMYQGAVAFFPGDVNGDGKTDIMQLYENATNNEIGMLVYFAMGTNFRSRDFSIGEGIGNIIYFPGDVNGDGKTDIMQIGPSATNVYINNRAVDHITSIINGLNKIKIDYMPLTDSRVYTKEDTAVYPLQDVSAPMNVVSSYTNSSGNDSYKYTYYYTGAKVSLDGRGWLGFHMVTMTDANDAKVVKKNRLTYMQDFPYTGMVKTNQVYINQVLINNGLDTEINYSYQNNVTSGVYQVLMIKEATTYYNFSDSQANYTVKKDYTYDSYGNVTVIADLGNTADPDDDVYTGAQYINDTVNWHFGFLADRKIATTKAACKTFAGWDSQDDLSWEQNTYDLSMNVVEKKQWDNGINQWHKSTYEFDGCGNPIKVTNPKGSVTQTDYDATYHTFPVKEISPALTAPNGRTLTTSYQYDPRFGVLVQETDPNGNIKQQILDGFGRVVEVKGPDPRGNSGAATVSLQKISFVKDPNNNGYYTESRYRTKWDDGNDANWHWQREYRDGLLRKYKTVSKGPATGRDLTQAIRFDAVGRTYQQSVPYYTGATPAYVTTVYTPEGKVAQVTAADGTITKYDYTYDQSQKAWQVKITEAFGTANARTTTNYVNAREQTIQQTAANGLVTDYTYSKLGQHTGTTVHSERGDIITTSIYDSLGRVIKSTSPDTGTETAHYNAYGEEDYTIDAKGQKTTYTYDALGRLLTKTTAGGKTTTFGYDNKSYANGQGYLTDVQSPEAKYTFGYDQYGRQTVEGTNINGTAYASTKAYDPLGRVSSYGYPDNDQLKYYYTADGRMQKIDFYHPNTGTGDTKTYATYQDYNALGQAQTIQYGNGCATTLTYNEQNGQLKTRQHKYGANTINQQYDWDPLGYLKRVNDPLQSTSPITYTHDNMGWLIQASGPYGAKAYMYDKVGNITQKDGKNYTYKSGTNRIDQLSDGTKFTYNPDGTMAAKGGYPYSYNDEKRLISAGSATATNQFTYDFTGQRLAKKDGAGNVTYYISPYYEVTKPKNGPQLYTKNVLGPDGIIATVTSKGSNAALIRSHNAQTEELLVNRRTLAGMIKYAGLNVKHIFTLPVNAQGSIQAMFMTLAGITVFLMLVLLLALMVRKTRINQRWLKRLTQFGQGFLTEYLKGNPVRASILIPFLALTLLLTGTGVSYAQMNPGANGAGIPEEGVLYFYQDQLGGTVLTTDATGKEMSRVTYDPFGTIYQAGSSGRDNFRPKFGGKELDQDSGLYYFGARYYDSQVGQFISPDPKRQFVSPYIYCNNAPESIVDPTGELATWAKVLIGVAVGVAAIGVIAATGGTAAPFVIGALAGAYMGGSMANNGDWDPGNWDYRSGKTWAGITVGAVVGAFGGALSSAAGTAAAASYGTSAGIVAEMATAGVIGGSENMLYGHFFRGDSGGQLAEDFGIGFGFGAAGALAGRGLYRLSKGQWYKPRPAVVQPFDELGGGPGRGPGGRPGGRPSATLLSAAHSDAQIRPLRSNFVTPEGPAVPRPRKEEQFFGEKYSQMPVTININ